MKHIILAALLLCASGAAHALYRCEINGKIEYRDLPCPAGRASEIRVDPMRPTAGDERAARLRAEHDKAVLREMDRRLAEDRRAADRAQGVAARDAERAHRRQVRCNQMARNLQWTTQTATKYRDDVWWQNQVRTGREDYNLDCR